MTLLPTTLPPAVYNTTMSTNHTDCPKDQTEEWVVNVVPVCVLIFTSLGIVFNVFVLMVFCLHKKRSTVAEIYFSNLAIADLVLLTCLPFWAVNISRRFDWPFGPVLCKVINTGINLNTHSSIYSLVLVSIDRYLALVHTMSHYQMRKPKNAKLGCLLVWVFSLCCNIPQFIYRTHLPKCDGYRCSLLYPSIKFMHVVEAMNNVINFILPVCIISFCTVSIVYALNNRFKPGFNGQKKEHKATILMLVVLLAFLICWTPFHLTSSVEIFVYQGGETPNVLNTCMQFFVYLAFFNSFLNPILYVLAGETFRVKVRELSGGVSSNMSTMHTALMRSIRSVNGQG